MSEKLQERRWVATPYVKPPWDRANVVAAASHPAGIKTLGPVVNKLVSLGMDSTLVVSESSDAIAALVGEYPWVRPPDSSKTRSEGQPFAFDSTPTLALFSASTFPEIHRDRFIPVGPPRCDFIYDEDLATTNRETRTQLDIPSDAIVIAHFAARGGDQYGENEQHATRAVGTAVQQLSQKHPDRSVVFIHRRHPGDKNSEIIQGVVNELPTSGENYRLVTRDQTERLTTAAVAAAVNLGIATLSLTLTEMALHGALRPEPRDTGWLPLFFLSAGARRILDELRYPLPTAVRLGAAASAEHEDELLPTMERALFDEEYRNAVAQSQEKDLGRAYRFKKDAARATTRAVLQIRRILEHKGKE